MIELLKRTAKLVTLSSALFLSGCQTYQAQPLSPMTVAAASQPPDFPAVRVAAAQLKHPMLPAIAIDGRDGLTPDEVAVMTVIVSPKLRALRDQAGVAQAQVIQAGLLPNPQLGYTLDKLTGNEDPALVNGASLGLSWEATSLLGYRQRADAAHKTSDALNLDIAWQEWQAAQAARLSAYRILSLERRLTFARDAERDLGEAAGEMRKAYDLRDKTAPDLAASLEAWSVARDARFALEQELSGEQFALRLGLGLFPDALLRIKIPAMEIILDRTWAAPALLAGLETRRLDLVALTLGYESSDATLRAAIWAQFPKVGLSFAKAHDTSDVKTRSFGVTVDLPLFDRNQGQIKIARATRQQLFDEYVVRVGEARADVVRILSNLAILQAQSKNLDEEVPRLEEITAALDRTMATRNADPQVWRDAHNALLTRRIEAVKIRQDLLDLTVALEIATGQPLLASRTTP